MIKSPDEWFTLPEVARAIGKSPAGVRFLVRQHKIDARKGPRGWWLVHRSEVDRLRREALRQLLERDKTTAASGEPEWVKDPDKASLNLRDQLAMTSERRDEH